jgi:hypothetical protein
MKPHSRTWVGQIVTDQVSLQSLLDSCLANIAKAAQEEGRMRALYARLAPGDVRLVGTQEEPPLGYQITREVQNQKHWREYAAHYRGRIAREGRDAMATVETPRRYRHAPAELPPVPEPDRRLPREPGDDEEEVVPF